MGFRTRAPPAAAAEMEASKRHQALVDPNTLGQLAAPRAASRQAALESLAELDFHMFLIDFRSYFNDFLAPLPSVGIALPLQREHRNRISDLP